MVRPVERFRIGPPRSDEEVAGGPCHRLRPGRADVETVGIGTVACWLLSIGLAGYAAWQLAGLWLAP